MATCPTNIPVRSGTCNCPPGTIWLGSVTPGIATPFLSVIGSLFGVPDGSCVTTGSAPRPIIPSSPAICPKDTTVVKGNCQCPSDTQWVLYNLAGGQEIGQCRSQEQIKKNLDQSGQIIGGALCSAFQTLLDLLQHGGTLTPDVLQGVFQCWAGQTFQVGSTSQTGSILLTLIQQGKIKIRQGNCDPGFVPLDLTTTYQGYNVSLNLCVDPSAASQFGLGPTGGSASGGDFLGGIGVFFQANAWLIPILVIGVGLVILMIFRRR